jgi:hypothetical protein
VTRWLPRTWPGFTGERHFQLVQADVVVADLAMLLKGVRAVFHFAELPGVRRSWGTGLRNNKFPALGAMSR